jgi:hypothetical protein
MKRGHSTRKKLRKSSECGRRYGVICTDMNYADLVSWGHQDAKKCLESFIMLNVESNPTKYTRVTARY